MQGDSQSTVARSIALYKGFDEVPNVGPKNWKF
jgi:hypothetical protein